jgi:uncharacterized protein (UPF0332 family)
VSLAADLIALAEHLANREPKKPKQASLRRSVSSAYYALFHALIHDGVTRLVPNMPDGLRLQAGRAYAHGEMKNTCVQFATAQGPAALGRLLSTPLEPQINSVARAFVDLQELRHRADYNLLEPFAKKEALEAIGLAKHAMQDWKLVRKNPNASVFLAAMLLQNRWTKSG